MGSAKEGINHCSCSTAKAATATATATTAPNHFKKPTNIQNTATFAAKKKNNYKATLKKLRQTKQLYATCIQVAAAQHLIYILHNKRRSADAKYQPMCPTTYCSEAVNLTEDADEKDSDNEIKHLQLVEKINNCKTFYEVLSVPKTASESDIKKAYKSLALQLHPDKNRAAGATEAFKILNAAIHVLCNPYKRRLYDLSDGTIYYPSFNCCEPNSCRRRQNTDNNDNDGKNTTSTNPKRKSSPYSSASNQYCYSGYMHVSSVLFSLLVATLLAYAIITMELSDAAYSLEPYANYNMRRVTKRLFVTYYVEENFYSSNRNSMQRLEQSVEHDYIYMLREKCSKELNYHEIDELIEKLKNTTVSPHSTGDITMQLLTEISATKDPKLFDKFELADFFSSMIQWQNADIRKEAAKCIAEITKSEVQRKKFTKPEFIRVFLDCLRDVNQDTNNMELAIQICRALGNICYLNDEARDIILEFKGDSVLIQLLSIIDIKDKVNGLHFIKVRGGLLSNYLLGGEGLAKRAMDMGIMDRIRDIINISIENIEKHEDLLLNTLPLMSILTENVSDLNFEKELNLQLSHILATSTNGDLAEMCLELLHYQAENDEVKLLLAKDGLCETIYNLLEKYKNLSNTCEARALMKLACELIVLILTGDDSMHYLYGTSLLKNMEDWLDSDDIDLLTTGVLALGNFARTDCHCIELVERKIVNRLLDVLSKNNGVNDDVRLQHALLSTLRNLVIPKPNKVAVIQAGLVKTILPMLQIHQPPVVFKLLGTLRMTVDGQEKLALELLKNYNLIEQLVHWSKFSDYAGVTGESLRLLAWLIKHAYIKKIAYALPRKGDAPPEQLTDKIPPNTGDYDRSSLNALMANDEAIEAVINMLNSQHLVMQNEALIALCILSVIYLQNDNLKNDETANKLQNSFIKYDVGKKLAELINKSSEMMTKEIVENLQNFINLLRCSDKLLQHLDENNINELLKSIPILTEYCTL